MPFSNPILGGDTLVRPAIQSPDYSRGAAGWRIAADGSAEFNDVIMRGDVMVGPSGEGQVVITDSIPAELAAYYSDYTALSHSLIKMSLGTAAGGGYHYEIAGYISADFIAWNTGWVDADGIVHETRSDSYFSNTGVTQTTLGVATDDNTSRIAVDGSMEFKAFCGFEEQVNFTGDTSWDSVSLPRGVVLCEQITAGSTPASIAEDLYFTTAEGVWVNARAYRVTIVMQLSSAVAQTPQIRLRQTDVAAGALLLSGAELASGVTPLQAMRIGVFRNTSGGDQTDVLTVTIQPSTAAAVTVTSPAGAEQSYIYVEDVGAASDFPSCPSVTA